MTESAPSPGVFETEAPSVSNPHTALGVSPEDSASPTPAGNRIATGLVDDRGVSRGWGRLVMVVFWAVGAGVVGLSLWQLFRDVASPVGPRLVTLFAGLVYIGAAIGITHNGRRMRRVAWACVSIAFAGPIIVGLVQLGVSVPAVPWSPWHGFGIQTGFVSLLLPLVGMAWLWWSNPSRIVQLSEGMDRSR